MWISTVQRFELQVRRRFLSKLLAWNARQCKIIVICFVLAESTFIVLIAIRECSSRKKKWSDTLSGTKRGMRACNMVSWDTRLVTTVRTDIRDAVTTASKHIIIAYKWVVPTNYLKCNINTSIVYIIVIVFLQGTCDKVYISTSAVQMHANYHRKDSAIIQEGFQRLRATEECRTPYCAFYGQRTTHFHCRRDHCQFTFKNKADMGKSR